MGDDDRTAAPDGIVIRPFATKDQDAARRIIVDGLAEHFGHVDEDVNADLEDITTSYAGDVFVVAVDAAAVVGTGALIYAGDGIGRVVRMSVRRRDRRRGIASAILARLIAHARERGYWRVVLETGNWEDSIGFYASCGFHETSRDAGGPNLALDL
ncbi:MAG: GNAT family N-acetyltransferase [Dehalococcoidia bacterium]